MSFNAPPSDGSSKLWPATTHLKQVLCLIKWRAIAPGLVFLATLVGCTRAAGPASRAPLTIIAASDLRFALDEAVRQFKSTSPEFEIKVIYGSSGNFYTQVSNGAPFDI